jgi:transposase-like protein
VLVTSDDHAGLRAAIERHFRGASWQRCQVHFARNLQGLVGAKHRARLAEELRAIFAATETSQARALARGCAERWRRSQPMVAAKLEEELEACLACYQVPTAHRVRVRTTNGIERLNQELKRRTRVVRIFPNRASLLRLGATWTWTCCGRSSPGRRRRSQSPPDHDEETDDVPKRERGTRRGGLLQNVQDLTNADRAAVSCPRV